MILLFIFYTLTLLVFFRSALILTGFWKDPILRRFEDYGDPEKYYYPLWELMLSTGILLILSREVVGSFMWGGLTPIVYAVGLFAILGSYFAYFHPEMFGQRRGLLLNNPRWLHDLAGRTSRYERRRIAYMWLRLPRRLRITYNSNDRAFREWADMVILSTLL